MGGKHDYRIRAGYEDSYDEEVEEQEAFNRRACERLSGKWSDCKEKAGAVGCPKCGRAARVKKYSVKRMLITRFGEVPVYRNYHVCHCGHGFYPRDIEMGFDEDNLSRDVVEKVLDFVVTDTFEASRERLELHHVIHLSATKLKHVFERKSAPFSDRERPCPVVPLPVGAKRKHSPIMIQVDGSMIRHTDGWHETKLMRVQAAGETGSVCLAETVDKNRFEEQLRESPGFAKLRKREVFWIADGAPWIWKMKDRLCPNARELLDFYHVLEHGEAAASQAYGEVTSLVSCFKNALTYRLIWECKDAVFDLVKEHISYRPRKHVDKQRAQSFGKFLDYLESNRERLDYRSFLERGWPIGNGEVESSHKSVLQKRMKLSGMMWSAKNAQRMAILRALRSSVGSLKFADVVFELIRKAA